MFRGKQTIRFCNDEPQVTVTQKVRQALGNLGQVTIDREGIIVVKPAEGFNSFLTEVTIGGRMAKEWNEYQVRIDYACEPTGATWAIVAVGTPLLLLGWAALLAPMSTKGRVGEAVRKALNEIEEALGGAATKRYGRKPGGGRG